MSSQLRVEFSINPDEATLSLDGAPVFWRTDRPFTVDHGNFALMAALPMAMSTGRPLHIAGEVDRTALRNATLLAHFWHQWVPDRYSPITITADSIAVRRCSSEKRVICLSGGADSTFALLSAHNDDHPLRLEVGTGIFVHGFDFSLDKSEGYERTLSSIRSVARSVGTDVGSVATNWRSVVCGSDRAEWEHVHTIGLAAIMHLFDGSHGGGILGSDYTFREDHTVAPWGSNSTVNRMLGSGSFPISPVGEHVSRSDKIAAIAKWGHLPELKVCWAGPQNGENCARCEKCLRTMLMCEAAGVDPTPAFGRRPDADDLKRISLHSPGKLAFFQQTLREDSKLSPELRVAVRRAIKRNRLRNFARPVFHRVRKRAKV